MDGTDNDALDDFRQIHCEEIDTYDTFGNLFSEKLTSSLKIIHINIRSYYKNFDGFLVFLEGIEVSFDIIVLTEAWLDRNKSVYSLNGYNCYHTTGNWNRNDGIVIYIKSEIHANCKEITLGEASGLLLDFKYDIQHFNLLATYRSPSMNCHSFLIDLGELYKNINKNTTYIFTGDINIDLLSNITGDEKEIYLDIL